MKQNIIISTKESSCLGHEIHVSRCVIIDMLMQKYINENDIIVVLNNDRKFLYEQLFKTVLNYNEVCLLNLNDYNIIDLSIFSHTAARTIEIKDFKYSDPYYNESFKNNLLKLNFCETNYDAEYSGDFVVIHQRYGFSYKYIKILCDKIINKYGKINIVIFNHDARNAEIKKFYNDINIIFTTNLQLYASYLNHNKCKLLISPWSGGGQLSQYCCPPKTKILYFLNKDMNEVYNIGDVVYYNNEKHWIDKAMTQTYFDAMDFKNPNDCCIKIFININDLYNNI